MDFLRNILQIPSSVSVSMKMPKFKKLRQWSHDSIVNLSQLTARNASSRQRQHSENPLPTTGITTISAAIHEQKIDPKKDNFGLYALKCDRSQSLANARRGILLNLPATTTKVKSNSFHSPEERNHEVFKSCETLENDNENNQRKLDEMSQQKPPPRKRKKAPQINALHQKPKQHVYKAGQSTTITMDSIEKNDSGLYKIVGATANITYVEPKKKVVAVVRPKVEKAVVVEMPKVKDYEWHKHQRERPSKNKIGVKKLSEVPNESKISDVDIFKTNSSTNKQNIFDEFDELFEKNKREVEAFQTPEVALKKLKELKTSSSSVSMVLVKKDQITPPVIKVRAVDNNKNLAARVKYVSTLLEEENFEIIDDKKQIEENLKPKIVSEQMKKKQENIDVNKKKIMYYNDENEMQEMIMKRVQTTETSKKMSTIDVKDYDIERANLNENQTSVDYKHPTQLVSNISNSNSLRRTVFVFNL